MADVNDNKHQIQSLTDNTSFYDWVSKENNEVIAKLNLLKVYDGLSGEGINVVVGTTGSNDGGAEGDVAAGVMRVTISDSIPKGITFQNDITVNGIVNYDFGKSETSSVKMRIYGSKDSYASFPGPSGWTGTGLTFGMPVYVGRVSIFTGATGGVSGDSIFHSGTGATMGLFKAQADSACNSEVLGLISGINTDYAEVTVAGKIGHPTLFANRFRVDASPFTSEISVTAGNVYFLHPGLSGCLSASEPEVSGQVSKPLFMAMGTTFGSVLGYRGQLLTSNTGDTGPGDTNKNIVDLGDTSHSDIVVGDIVGFNPDASTTDFDSGDYGDREVYGGWFRCSSEDSTAHDAVGIVVRNITNQIIEIQTSGYLNDLDSSITETGPLFLGANGKLTPTPGSVYKQFAFVFSRGGANRAVVVNQQGVDQTHIPFSSTQTGSARSNAQGAGGTAGGGIGENTLINGGFDIWQRGVATDTAYGTTGSIYFADRWVRVDGITSAGATAAVSLQRKEFATNQTAVEGNPKYYVRANHGLSAAASDYVYIENRIEDVRTFNDELTTFSFFAKCASAGKTLGIKYTQNYAGDSSKQIITNVIENGISLTSSWKRYSVTFNIPGLYDNSTHSASPSGQHYCAIGFDLTKANAVNVDLAQVKFERGGNMTRFEPVDKTEELEKCSRYYQRSYGRTIKNRQQTMMSACLPDPSVVDWMVPQSRDYYHRFPVEMRDDPTVNFYSPKSGTTGEAFNRTACKDVRLTSGTKGYLDETRVSPIGTSSMSVTPKKHGMRISVGGGSALLDNISLHYVADSDLNNNL